MITLFYVTFALAVWHFFYESILAPSLRHGLRYEFFQLRDDLRRLNIEGLSKKDKDIYQILDGTICELINSLSVISVLHYHQLKKSVESKPNHKEELEFAKNFVESASNEELINIDERILKLGQKALFINNGGWFIYLVGPLTILVFIKMFTSGLDKFTSRIADIIGRLIYNTHRIKNRSGLEFS